MNPISYVKSHGIKGTWDIIYRYKIDQGLHRLAVKLTAKRPLQDIIVIESHNDFDSNGGAFYDYLLKNHYNDKYKIVWLLKNKKPDNLPKNVSAFYLYKPRLKKQMTICTAKYILTCQDAIGSVRDGQISVYMTHGPLGLKAFKGKCDLPENLTYILMPSEYLLPILSDQYQIEHSKIRTLLLGYPMYDCLYTADKGDLSKITSHKFKKVILWMPTFRKGIAYGREDSTASEPLGIPIFNTLDEMKEMNDYLQAHNSLLIIKIHPMQDLNAIKVHDYSNIKVLNGKSVKELRVKNERLMKDADALISDYSSAAYDYMHLDRPVGFTMDDANKYKLGFIVDDPKELIGGQIINSKHEFLKFINDVIDGKDPYRDKRHEVFNKSFKFHDGNSSKRLADFLNL
jgi:CDP-glycerol glycerophosphotransferase (TagB/SpsB family)